MERDMEIMQLILDMWSLKYQVDIPVELPSRQNEQSLKEVWTWDHMCTQRPKILDVA